MRDRHWMRGPLAALLTSLATCVVGAESPTRPNVVVILCDDLGYGDLGCYGAADIPTPHLDRMAAEGVRFTHFYAPASVCTPSRAGLLTGRHPVRLGLSGVLHPHDRAGLAQSETTLAEMLRAAGYATGCFGKWHLGHLPEFLPHNHGFDESLAIPYSHDMYRGAPWAKPGWTASWPEWIPLMRGGQEVERLRGLEAFSTLTTRCTDAACDFVARHAGEPFFLFVPQPMPHQEIAPPVDWRGRAPRGPYGDAVAELDASVGRILAVLAEHRLDDDTLVVVTSDNGPARVYQEGLGAGGSAGPLSGGKTTCREGGVRVPCVVRWPRHVPAGAVCEEVATALDILPTVASVTGATRPEIELDGRNIATLLERPGDGVSPHTVLPYYHGDTQQAVRMGRWKLWLDPLQLYDVVADPAERHDRAPSEPDIVAALTRAASGGGIEPAGAPR